MLSDEKRAALIQMCHEAGVRVQLDSKFGHPDYTSVQSSWPELEKLATAVAEAAVKDAVGGEPVAVVDASDDGWFASILPDTSVKLGQLLYTRPQASAAVPEDKWKPLLEAVMREMPSREYRGNAPGHAHAVPGIWDSDNVPYLAGKPCAWCLAYSTARKLLAASQPEVNS